MLEFNEILETNYDGLQFSIGHHNVYPLSIGSRHGTVRGGIPYLPNHPAYYNHLRWKNGRQISMTRWRFIDWSRFPRPSPTLPLDDGVTFYVGPAHRHFGHFSVESLSRTWLMPIAQSLFGKDRIRYLILPEFSNLDESRNFSFSDLLPWQAQIFNVLGITAENAILLTSPTRFSKLIVPMQAISYGGEYHARAAQIVANRTPAEDLDHLWPDTDTKIFLTRGRKYLKSGYIAGTRYLEFFFARNGYRIVDNEEFSALKQVAWAYRAKSVMAIQSSSMHIFNIIGNTTARFGYLKRLQKSLDRNMAGSLKGLIDLSHSLDFNETIAPPGSSQEREHLCVFRDTSSLLSFFKQFDEAIDIETFNADMYLQSVEEDIAEVTAASPIAEAPPPLVSQLPSQTDRGQGDSDEHEELTTAFPVPRGV